MTTAAKNKQVAEAAEPVPDVVMRSPGEQLAADLNAKAQVRARAQQGDGQYRDPQVRTASGQQVVAQQQSATGMFNAPTQPPASAPAAPAPASIAGLITQPTLVNANRSSIYAAPAPIAANPDGTLAPVSPVATPAATPLIRNVYSLPPGAALDTPPAGATPIIPSDPQALNAQLPAQPQANVPHYAPQAASGYQGKPTAGMLPSRILPAPGEKGRHVDSQEALMMARNMANGNQGSGNSGAMPGASGLMLDQSHALPQGNTAVPPGVVVHRGEKLPKGFVAQQQQSATPATDITMTPGMAASLK